MRTKRALQVREATHRLTQQLGHTPTDAELAGQQLGLFQMHVSRLLARTLGYLRPRDFGQPGYITDAVLDPHEHRQRATPPTPAR